ncbi:unnamed protein product, partial [Prorocentrum cordatum]
SICTAKPRQRRLDGSPGAHGGHVGRRTRGRMAPKAAKAPALRPAAAAVPGASVARPPASAPRPVAAAFPGASGASAARPPASAPRPPARPPSQQELDEAAAKIQATLRGQQERRRLAEAKAAGAAPRAKTAPVAKANVAGPAAGTQRAAKTPGAVGGAKPTPAAAPAANANVAGPAAGAQRTAKNPGVVAGAQPASAPAPKAVAFAVPGASVARPPASAPRPPARPPSQQELDEAAAKIQATLRGQQERRRLAEAKAAGAVPGAKAAPKAQAGPKAVPGAKTSGRPPSPKAQVAPKAGPARTQASFKAGPGARPAGPSPAVRAGTGGVGAGGRGAPKARVPAPARKLSPQELREREEAARKIQATLRRRQEAGQAAPRAKAAPKSGPGARPPVAARAGTGTGRTGAGAQGQSKGAGAARPGDAAAQGGGGHAKASQPGLQDEAPEPRAPKVPDIVVGVRCTFMVQNIDMEQLEQTVRIWKDFVEKVKQAVATESRNGITTDDVEVHISDDYLMAEVFVLPSNTSKAKPAKATLASSPTLGASLLKRVASVYGIDSVSEGPLKVEGVSVVALTASVFEFVGEDQTFDTSGFTSFKVTVWGAGGGRDMGGGAGGSGGYAQAVLTLPAGTQYLTVIVGQGGGAADRGTQAAYGGGGRSGPGGPNSSGGGGGRSAVALDGEDILTAGGGGGGGWDEAAPLAVTG